MKNEVLASANFPPRLLLVLFYIALPILISGCSGQSGGGSPGGPGAAGGGAGGPGGKPPEVLGVLATNPVPMNVTEYEEFTGRTWAVETVELRSRVTGYLEQIHFEDAADVAAGDLLFEIDRRQFEGEAERSRAAVAQIEARVRRLTSQMNRARELETKGAISIDNMETAQFDLEEAEAALSEARAQLELAELNVQYASIRAPISGRIGRRLVDRGNLVIEDQTALATIVPQEKIHVYFDIDERTVLRLRREEARTSLDSTSISPPTSQDFDEAARDRRRPEEVALTAADSRKSSVPEWKSKRVQIALADSEAFDLSGEIDFMDNQVDPATGTLRARAVLDNQSGLLTPGLFVRVRYPLTENEEVLSIPEESIGSLQGNRVVYVARETSEGLIAVQLSDKVPPAEAGQNLDEARRPDIEFGPLNGGMRAVRHGLSRDDLVITTGLHRLKKDSKIKILSDKSAGDKAGSGGKVQPKPSNQPAR